MEPYDFGGWATRNDLTCSDGRVITRDAFRENDGQTVPLVWNHQHNEPENVLGHALLENRPEGVYAYCTLNGTESGKNARLLIEHGDISALSIYANKLKQRGNAVLHGVIREVSLVLAGANPGATIESVISHGEESDEEAVFYTGEDIELAPREDAASSYTSPEPELMHSGEDAIDYEEDGDTQMAADSDASIQDIIDTMDDDQQDVLYALVGLALEEGEDIYDEEEDEVKHNVFDDDYEDDGVLMHDAMDTIIGDAKRFGSMKESFLEHADEYGIESIDYLFPDEKSMTTTPQFISRETGWVPKVMGAVHHTPFSRIKSVFADITGEEARARGYLKGNLKKDEVFSLLKRTTTPTTIYKKQRMDRDDVVDITDFDVVSWLKTEMRQMLDEEIARAILVGDGRIASDDDKINETNIRPIWTDEDLYTIKAAFDVPKAATDDDKAKAFIRAAIKARKDYRGSGSPTLFTTEDVLTNCLLLTDNEGRDLYDSVEKLATKLRVREIVTVEVMEGLRREVTGKKRDLFGIIVNLADYNVGADRGGAINMFDDFDIDYNQQKYLIETRCSGALTKPFSAIAVECVVADS